MFTGLIEDIGTLTGVLPLGKTARLTLQTRLPGEEFAIGDSLAVNGTCLTIEKIFEGQVQCFCLAETLSRTNLGKQPIGAKLNLERALRADSRLGGHFVTGHVDFTSRILSTGVRGEDFEIEVEIPEGEEDFFVEKGSVALDGVSLTVARLSSRSFTICMIPHTAEATTLPLKKQGEWLNIETDILGKYIVHSLRRGDGKNDRMLMKKLQDNGFL